MTIKQSIDTMQAWTHALRLIMGYPAYAPIGNPVAFACGGRKNPVEALHIASIVEQSDRDMVYVNFGEPIAAGPLGVSLATRSTLHVDWDPEVRLFAADDHTSVELLTSMRRWSVGPRSVLTASLLPPRNRIARGVERANYRWREVAARAHGVALTGSVFVPLGASYADGRPMEALCPA